MHAFLLANKQILGFYKLVSVRNVLALESVPVDLHLVFSLQSHQEFSVEYSKTIIHIVDWSQDEDIHFSLCHFCIVKSACLVT